MKKAEIIKAYLTKNPNCTSREAAEATGATRRYVRMLKQEKSPANGSKEVIGVLSDVHVPYQDIKVVAKAIKKLKAQNIDRLVMLGDVCDFYSISYFKKDPRRMRFSEELRLCREWLKKLRVEFPDIPIDYIEGNHEVRLFSYLVDKAPELIGTDNLTVAGILGLDELNINYFDNVDAMTSGGKPYMRGRLIFMHGHEVRMGFSSVNLPRLMFQKAHANILFGHFHKQQSYITKDALGHHWGCWSVGCLCHLAEKFMPVNEWSHGYAVVTVDHKTGAFNVENKLLLDGGIF